MTSYIVAPNRLEGTKEEVGGLVTMKKKNKKESKGMISNIVFFFFIFIQYKPIQK